MHPNIPEQWIETPYSNHDSSICRPYYRHRGVRPTCSRHGYSAEILLCMCRCPATQTITGHKGLPRFAERTHSKAIDIIYRATSAHWWTSCSIYSTNWAAHARHDEIFLSKWRSTNRSYARG